jgi:hypothetical protein
MTTDTERPDEGAVAAPHFEARLWQELERLHEQQRLARPAGTPAPDGRRSWSLRVGIGLVAAAAAIAGILVVRDRGSDAGGTDTRDAPAAPSEPTGGAEDPAPSAPPPVSIETRIINATEEAVAASVVKVTQVDAAGQSGNNIMWTDEQSGRFRSLQLNLAGEHSFDSGPAVPTEVDTPPPDFPDRPNVMPMDPDVPQILTRTVDYCFRQYTEADNFAVPGSSAASDIREQIESGELVADGTQVYEGRELLKYQEVMLEDPTLTDLGWLLIDPETYRPVYRVGYPGSHVEYTMVIEFLPRTPENLAQLEPPIPAGFEKVDQLRGDGERADAGCGL